MKPLECSQCCLHSCSSQYKVIIFSGGTAVNSICSGLKSLCLNAVHVLPVSDLLDVFGGPAIGDIRSRLIRLADDRTVEGQAVISLLQHRLPACPQKAFTEWQRILNREHHLWKEIPRAYQDTIMGFFRHFQDLLDVNCPDFKYSHSSIGNFFFTGARLFFKSLDAAIFWFSRVARIPSSMSVLPIINTNHSIRIAVELENGEKIIGQNNISHPNTKGPVNVVNKDSYCPLPSKINRLMYVNDIGDDVLEQLNDDVREQLSKQRTVIYAMGSLYTSLLPSLILRGIGELISAKQGNKILILNGYWDRETHFMSAEDFVHSITNALNRWGELSNPPNSYISHLLYMKEGKITVEESKIKDLGISLVEVKADKSSFNHITPSAAGLLNSVHHSHRVFYNIGDLLEKLVSLCG